MFPLHPSEDLFPIPSDLEQPPEDHPSTLFIQQDLILTDYHHHHHDYEHQPSPYHSLPDPFISGHVTSNDISNNKGDGDEREKKKKKKKKIIHREVERQRRLYMNTLYASLRSLLPPQFLQGKRAIPDQLNAALDYITWLQENIKGLETKRAKLKKISYEMMHMSNISNAPEEDQMAIGSCYIAIRPYPRGVEVVIHSGREEKSTPSSRVIKLLLDEGMDVVSCTTAKIKDATHVHTIQSEKLDKVLNDVRDMIA